MQFGSNFADNYTGLQLSSHGGIGINWAGGKGNKCPPPPPTQYFFNLAIFWLLKGVMTNKNWQKQENEKFAFDGISLPLFQIWLLCKIKLPPPSVISQVTLTCGGGGRPIFYATDMNCGILIASFSDAVILTASVVPRLTTAPAFFKLCCL
jgi:hypothetical protein